jgi:hypothetical protein
VTGATEWVATPYDLIREENIKSRRDKRSRVPPPVVVKVMRFQKVKNDDIIGVALVPFDDLIAVKPVDPNAFEVEEPLTYSLKPWDVELWMDGNPTKADLKRKLRNPVGSPFGSVSVSRAQFQFHGTNEVHKEQAPVAGVLSESPVIRKLRLEVLGIEVRDILGLHQELRDFIAAAHPRTNAAIAAHKADVKHMSNAALRRTLLAHDPGAASSGKGASCDCRISWQDSSTTMHNVPFWWSGFNNSRGGGHRKSFSLKLPLDDSEEFPKLEFEISIGSSFLGGLDFDWSRSLKFLVPTYRTTIDPPKEIPTKKRGWGVHEINWGDIPGLNGPISEQDASLHYKPVCCADEDEDEGNVPKLFAVALLSPVKAGLPPSAAFPTRADTPNTRRKRGLLGRNLSALGLGQKEVIPPHAGTAHVKFCIMRARDLIFEGVAECFTVTDIVDMSTGKHLPAHTAKTAAKRTSTPVWEGSDVVWEHVALEPGVEYGLRVAVFANKTSKQPVGMTVIPLAQPQGTTGARWFELVPVLRARGGLMIPVESGSGSGFVKVRLTTEFGPEKEPDITVSRILPHAKLHFRLIVEECRPVSEVGMAALTRARAEPPSKKTLRLAKLSEHAKLGVDKLPPTEELTDEARQNIVGRMRFMVHSVVKTSSMQAGGSDQPTIRVTAEWCDQETAEGSYEYFDNPPPLSPPDMLGYLRFLFECADRDSSGYLTKSEFEGACLTCCCCCFGRVYLKYSLLLQLVIMILKFFFLFVSIIMCV